jgi:CubicO group peptidase (beta-lactamase class C family)
MRVTAVCFAGRILPAIALPAVLTACSGSSPETAPSAASAISSEVEAATSASAAEKAVVAYVEGRMQSLTIPGAQIAIVRNGKLAYRKALGVKQQGQTARVTNETRFRVASLSKMLAATTALSLVDDGKLDLAAPVTTYIPTWKLASTSDPTTVTLDQLLSHDSGLADLKISFLSCSGDLTAWFTTSDVSSPLWTPPGAVWNYSNRGYSVAGWALESAGGEAFENLVSERVLVPAGMTTATYDPALAVAGDHAVGHEIGAGGAVTLHDMTDYDCAAAHPPAGVMATATDYAHFIETLYADDGSMLSPASLATLTTGRVPTDDYPTERYAYGLEDYLYKGVLRVLHHNGEFDSGYYSSLWMVPEAKFGIVVFYNSTAEVPDNVSRYALDEFFGLASTPYPVVTTAPSTWGVYGGSYLDPYELGAIQVRQSGGTLLVDIPRLGASGAALTQVAGDAFSFSVAGSTWPVTFYRNDPSGDAGAATPAPWFVTRAGVGARQD